MNTQQQAVLAAARVWQETRLAVLAADEAQKANRSRDMARLAWDTASLANAQNRHAAACCDLDAAVDTMRRAEREHQDTISREYTKAGAF